MVRSEKQFLLAIAPLGRSKQHSLSNEANWSHETHYFSSPATDCQSDTDCNGFRQESTLSIYLHPLIWVAIVLPVRYYQLIQFTSNTQPVRIDFMKKWMTLWGSIITLRPIKSTAVCSSPYILLRQIEDSKPAIAPPNKAISSQYNF